MEPDQLAGQGIGMGHKSFCAHRRSIVKRWQTGKKFYAIIRCRWCDVPWVRKEIALDQDSANGLQLLTRKFVEQSESSPNAL